MQEDDTRVDGERRAAGPTGSTASSNKAVRPTRGLVLVFIDEKGNVIAHAGDFEPQAPGGFTLREGQSHRARRALALAVSNAYASPMFVRGMDAYDCQNVMDRLIRVHGCKVHEVAIGHDE